MSVATDTLATALNNLSAAVTAAVAKLTTPNADEAAILDAAKQIQGDADTLTNAVTPPAA
jgi:hypothetical protein